MALNTIQNPTLLDPAGPCWSRVKLTLLLAPPPFGGSRQQASVQTAPPDSRVNSRVNSSERELPGSDPR